MCWAHSPALGCLHSEKRMHQRLKLAYRHISMTPPAGVMPLICVPRWVLGGAETSATRGDRLRTDVGMDADVSAATRPAHVTAYGTVAQEVESPALALSMMGVGVGREELGGGTRVQLAAQGVLHQDDDEPHEALRRGSAVWSPFRSYSSGGVSARSVAARTKRRPKFHSGGKQKGPTPHA